MCASLHPTSVCLSYRFQAVVVVVGLLNIYYIDCTCSVAMSLINGKHQRAVEHKHSESGNVNKLVPHVQTLVCADVCVHKDYGKIQTLPLDPIWVISTASLWEFRLEQWQHCECLSTVHNISMSLFRIHDILVKKMRGKDEVIISLATVSKSLSLIPNTEDLFKHGGHSMTVFIFF